MYQSLIEILRFRANFQPDKHAYTFLNDGEETGIAYTYSQVNRKAENIAITLGRTTRAGDRAVLLYPPGLEFIAAFFGCLYSQVIAVPTNLPNLNIPDKVLLRIGSILKDADPSVILTTSNVLARLDKTFSNFPELKRFNWVATDMIPCSDEKNWEPQIISESIPAFLQYTSGSTSAPIGVIVSHSNLMHNLDAIKKSFGHSENSQGVIWLPPFHDMGLIGGILQPLYCGFPVTLMSPLNFLQQPFRWLKAISTYKGTTSGGPNFAYNLCIEKVTAEQKSVLDLSSWTVAFNGAERINHNTLEKFSECFGPCGFNKNAFYPCYGLSESTLIISGGEKLTPPVIRSFDSMALRKNKVQLNSGDEEDAMVLVSCGKTIENHNILIVDSKTSEKCLPEQIGEIWATGPSVAKGYWNKKETTALTFNAKLAGSEEPIFLRTGDLGFIYQNELFITGRLKELIIVNGRNHYPQDIELTVSKCFSSLKMTNSGAAFSFMAEEKEHLVILQETERSFIRNINFEEIADKIYQAIAINHELQIHTLIFLKPGSLPKTSSGKVQRNLCRQQFLAQGSDLRGCIYAKSYDLLQMGINGSFSINHNLNVSFEKKEERLDNKIKFSLFYFASKENEFQADKYKLFFEGAKYADKNGFEAIWTPERHFHAFGGLFPNPSILTAALAMVTEKIRLRAGSVVLPLHHPVRVAEEWSVVDNLSSGRVDIAFARGWNVNDFILSPGNYEKSKDILFSSIRQVQELWRGETLNFINGAGNEVGIKIYPSPKQKTINVWVTCSGGEAMFAEAGASGANVLTALLFQSVEQLAGKIEIYRKARAKSGFDPKTGKVTLMLHTFIGSDFQTVKSIVKKPFTEYLRSSYDLWKSESKKLAELTENEQEKLLEFAFERYFETTSLFGTPTGCLDKVEEFKQIGVTEIACLIDFGIDTGIVLSHLPHLNRLKDLASESKEADHKQILPDILFVPDREPPSGLQSGNYFTDTLNTNTASAHSQSNQDLYDLLFPYHKEDVLLWLQNEMSLQISTSLNIDCSAILTDRNFNGMGIDSLKAIEILANVGNLFDISLSPILLYEYPTIEKLAADLLHKHEIKIVNRFMKANSRFPHTAPHMEAPKPNSSIHSKPNNPEIRNDANLENLLEDELAQLLAYEIESNRLGSKK